MTASNELIDSAVIGEGYTMKRSVAKGAEGDNGIIYALDKAVTRSLTAKFRRLGAKSSV